MRIYVWLEKRPKDIDAWPVVAKNLCSGEHSKHRVSAVRIVDLAVDPNISAEAFDQVLWEAG